MGLLSKVIILFEEVVGSDHSDKKEAIEKLQSWKVAEIQDDEKEDSTLDLLDMYLDEKAPNRPLNRDKLVCHDDIGLVITYYETLHSLTTVQNHKYNALPITIPAPA